MQARLVDWKKAFGMAANKKTKTIAYPIGAQLESQTERCLQLLICLAFCRKKKDFKPELLPTYNIFIVFF